MTPNQPVHEREINHPPIRLPIHGESMKVCTWTPDTCSCQIEYEWDETTDETHRPTHIFHKVVKNCGIHGKQGSQLFDHVREEVGRKSNTVTAILKVNGVDRSLFPAGPSGDDQFNQLNNSVLAGIDWGFDPPDETGFRKLKVKLTNNQLNPPTTPLSNVTVTT